MELPYPPPTLPRRIKRPLHVVLLLAGLASLPTFVVASGAHSQSAQSVLHVLATFAALTLAFRLIGKRELGRLSPFELVTLMLIPEILSNSLQGQGSMLTSLAGLSTVLLLVLSTSLLSQRFPRIQSLLEAAPSVLVVDGELLEDAMNRERIAPEELMSEMRKQGLLTLAEVRFAVLESSGNITFIAKTSQTQRGSDDQVAA